MGRAVTPATVKLGGEWAVPEGSIVTTPSGRSFTVTGGVYVVTETGTHTNDTGDSITGKDRG